MLVSCCSKDSHCSGYHNPPFSCQGPWPYQRFHLSAGKHQNLCSREDSVSIYIKSSVIMVCKHSTVSRGACYWSHAIQHISVRAHLQCCSQSWKNRQLLISAGETREYAAAPGRVRGWGESEHILVGTAYSRHSYCIFVAHKRFIYLFLAIYIYTYLSIIYLQQRCVSLNGEHIYTPCGPLAFSVCVCILCLPGERPA